MQPQVSNQVTDRCNHLSAVNLQMGKKTATNHLVAVFDAITAGY